MALMALKFAILMEANLFDPDFVLFLALAIIYLKYYAFQEYLVLDVECYLWSNN